MGPLVPAGTLLPGAPLCWPARWGAVLARGLGSSVQARLGRLSFWRLRPRGFLHPHQVGVPDPCCLTPCPPASTPHAPGGLAARGPRARPASLPRPSPPGKLLRFCSDAAVLRQAPLTTTIFYFLGNMCLTFIGSISNPPPPPLAFLFWPVVQSLPWGSKERCLGGDTRLPPVMLPGSGTVGLSCSWRVRQTSGRTS